MRQDEFQKIEQLWTELKYISEAMKTLADSQNVSEILRDSCVDRVGNKVKSIDDKLNDIITAVTVMKTRLNGSASKETEHIWAHLNTITERMAAIVEEDRQMHIPRRFVEAHRLAVCRVEATDRAVKDEPFEPQFLG